MILKFFKRQMSLSASQVKGTAAILSPDSQFLSPALGLILKESNSFTGNLLRTKTNSSPIIPGLQQSSLLARELFFQRAASEPPAVTRSKSRASFFLTPQRLGHIVGYAISTRSFNRKEMEAIFLTTGIVPKSSKAGRRVAIDGIRTNISLTRFMRVCEYISKGHAECKQNNVASTPLLLILRFLWEKSISKQCLLDFLETVNTYTPIFKDGNLTSEMRATFLKARWSRDILEDTDLIQAAAIRLFSKEKHLEDTSDVELIAASLSSANAHKPAIKLSRHGYNNAAEKPDCVEVVIREMFDLLLFDSLTNAFNPASRLPTAACPTVRAFYEQHSEIFVQDDDGAIEAARSKQWFEICSGLQGGVEYTASSTSPLIADITTMSSSAKNQVDVVTDYELVPSLANVSKTMGVLLFGGTDIQLETLEDVAEKWSHEKTTFEKLIVYEKIESFRAPMSEETVHREVGGIKFQNGHHSIEFDLERSHNLAITRHKRTKVEWTAIPKEIALKQWIQEIDGKNRSPFVQAFRPALLGDSMLQSMAENITLQNKAQNVESKTDFKKNLHHKVMEGWLSSRWGEDRRSMSTLEATDLVSCSAGGHLFSSTDKQAITEELVQVKHALEILKHLHREMENVEEENEEKIHVMLYMEHILKIILPKLEIQSAESDVSPFRGLTGEALSSTSTLEVARLLCAFGPTALERAGIGCPIALEQAGIDICNVTPLLNALVCHRILKMSLLEASKGLNFTDTLRLIQFRVFS